ncbi:MAG: orotate phosphoribosyltransferase [Nocardioidaceae bacterium]
MPAPGPAADSRADLAALLYGASHLTGSFVLRSGETASEYFDKYQFESRPDLLRRIAVALAALVPADIEVLAGLEMGGIPVATALSLETGIPAVFVRKRAKEYGTRRTAEGVEVAGRRVLVIEDVVSSGGQIVLSSGHLREAGANVSQALCVIDRRTPDMQVLPDAGIELLSLFTVDDLRGPAS